MMTAEIIPFDFEEHAVRVIMRGADPWFVAADVCRVLEIGNPSDVVARLDSDERMTLDTIEGQAGQRGGARRINVISESGLYAVILTSRKESARRFRKWVTAEVLPALRTHGRYEMPNAAAGPVARPVMQIEVDRYVQLVEFERDEALRHAAGLSAILRESREIDTSLREMMRAGTMRPRRISELEEAAIATLFEHGYSVEDVSRITGRSDTAIRARAFGVTSKFEVE